MNLATTRGCPYHCNWCAKPIYGQRYAVRSARAVAEELAWLSRTYAPGPPELRGRHLRPAPALGGGVRGRGRAAARYACRSSASRRADLLGERRWTPCGARAAARCGWARSRDRRRSWTPWRRARAWSRSARPRSACARRASRSASSCSSATRARRRRTSSSRGRWCATAAPTTSASPWPTRCRARPSTSACEAELGDKRHWEHSDDLAMMYRGPFPTRFYRRLHRLVHAEFRLRRLGELPRLGARQRATWLYHRLTLPLDEAAWRRSARAPQQRGSVPCRSRSTRSVPRSPASNPVPDARPAPRARLLPRARRPGAARHEALSAPGPALPQRAPQGARLLGGRVRLHVPLLVRLRARAAPRPPAARWASTATS